jgi:hypothetical protein
MDFHFMAGLATDAVPELVPEVGPDVVPVDADCMARAGGVSGEQATRAKDSAAAKTSFPGLQPVRGLGTRPSVALDFPPFRT